MAETRGDTNHPLLEGLGKVRGVDEKRLCVCCGGGQEDDKSSRYQPRRVTM